jgi:hypothetical protein
MGGVSTIPSHDSGQYNKYNYNNNYLITI